MSIKHVKFSGRSLRGFPLTAVRVTHAVKFCFMRIEEVPQPYNLEKWQLECIRVILKRCMKMEVSMATVRNLICSLMGAQVDLLQCYMLSSTFTFAYHAYRFRKNGACREVYNDLQMARKPSRRMIEIIVNRLICRGSTKEGSYLSESDLDNFENVLRTRSCLEEIQILMTNEKRLLRDASKYRQDYMSFFFKLLEVSSMDVETVRNPCVLYKPISHPDWYDERLTKLIDLVSERIFRSCNYMFTCKHPDMGPFKEGSVQVIASMRNNTLYVLEPRKPMTREERRNSFLAQTLYPGIEFKDQSAMHEEVPLFEDVMTKYEDEQ